MTKIHSVYASLANDYRSPLIITYEFYFWFQDITVEVVLWLQRLRYQKYLVNWFLAISLQIARARSALVLPVLSTKQTPVHVQEVFIVHKAQMSRYLAHVVPIITTLNASLRISVTIVRKECTVESRT